MADLGYDARWHSIRASDIGAPHNRFRVFVVATDATGDARWLGHRDRPVAALAADFGHERPWGAWDGRPGSADGGLLPTPRATDGTKGEPNQRGSSGDLMLPSAVAALLPTPVASEGTKPSNTMGVARRAATGEVFLTNVIVTLCGLDPSEDPTLLPTPAVNDMGDRPWANPETWDAWVEKHRERGINGNGHGKSLAIEAQRLLPTPVTEPTTGNGHARNLGTEARLLPTPTSMDSHASGGGYNGQTNVTLTDATARQTDRWGDYAAAIARWEDALGRPAPAPTMTSTKGNPQLSPAFVEWMMGLPAGWVTDTPDLTRNQALKALGNGVVPQQAYAAIVTMLGWPDPT